MLIRVKKDNNTTVLLKMAIIMYFSSYFISNSYMTEISMLPRMSTAFRYCSILLLCMGIISQTKQISLRQLLVLTIIIAVGVIVGTRLQDSNDFWIVILFMLAGRKSNPEDIYKFTFGINFFWLTLIIACALGGMITNVSFSTITHPNRVYLGFTAPNACQLFYFCMLLFISYKKQAIKIWHIVGLFIMTVWLYSYNDGLGALFYSILALIIITVVKFIHKDFWEKNWLIYLSYIIIPLCIIVSFVFPIMYNMNVKAIVLLNELTSTRISLAAQALQRYEITLFGQMVNFNYTLSGSYDSSAAYFYVDSSYLKYILMYGIIFIGIILCFYHVAIKYAIKKRDIYLLVSFFGALTYFIWNPQLLYVPYNPFIIVIMWYIEGYSNLKRKVKLP